MRASSSAGQRSGAGRIEAREPARGAPGLDWGAVPPAGPRLAVQKCSESRRPSRRARPMTDR